MLEIKTPKELLNGFFSILCTVGFFFTIGKAIISNYIAIPLGVCWVVGFSSGFYALAYFFYIRFIEARKIKRHDIIKGKYDKLLVKTQTDGINMAILKQNVILKLEEEDYKNGKLDEKQYNFLKEVHKDEIKDLFALLGNEIDFNLFNQKHKERDLKIKEYEKNK